MSAPDIPAGWQPDPRGRHEYRYWDGSQWTDHVSNQGQVSSDPVADASPAASGSESEAAPAASESSTSAASEPSSTASEPSAAREEETVVHEPTPAASEPEPVAARPDPEPTSTPTPTPDPVPAAAATGGATAPAASSAPPAGTTAPATAQTDAKAAAQDVMHSRSPELATILSAVVPGSGHFYMGTNKVPLAAGLLVATLAAVIISHISFLFFVIGFVIWAAAAVFALTDLRGGVGALQNATVPRNVVGILLIGAGVLLVLSLLLPYYRVSVSAEAAGASFSQSEMVSGFQAFGIIDIILLIVGIVALVAGAASLGLGPLSSAELPSQLPLAVAIGGAVATLLILFRMFIDPADTSGLDGLGIEADIAIGRAFGIWLGLWSAMVLLLSNLGLLRSAKRS